METSQFEAVKVGLKQDNSGYILTLRIHPDEIPEEIARDYTTNAEVQRITDHIDQRFNRLEEKIDQLIRVGR